ncbi:MAG TPA: HAD family hydrolase [Acidimicrobiia bacterium]|jgi:putative hydrolase of the HAD superfamily
MRAGPTPTRAVVLDFFGTLARTTASVGIDEILARHGHSIPEHLQEMWWSGDIDGSEHVEQSQSREHYLAWQRERLVAMLHEADVHPGEHDAILADLQEGRAVRVLEAYDEVPGVLRELRDRDVTLAICSNWDWDLEPAVAECGLDGWFDTLVSSAWAGARKPHPRIYRYLLDQTGLDPAEILFVGDTWGPDVEGPLAAGMTPAYLERDGHWPDPTRPADTSGVHVHRVRDLRGLLPLLGTD